MSYCVVTTFPYDKYEVYGKLFLASFVKHWPKDISIYVQLDDYPSSEEAVIVNEVSTFLEQVGRTNIVNSGFSQKQHEFLDRRTNDAPTRDYRFQYKRFSYKVFAMANALDAIRREENERLGITHLIWLDADVVTTKDIKDISAWLPSPQEKVSYLGRKDWPHSECGFMAFDLSTGAEIIERMTEMYVDDSVLGLEQWHDSFVFDYVRKEKGIEGKNLTLGKPGMEIWHESPLQEFMTHHKGVVAKEMLKQEKVGGIGGDQTLETLSLKTKNCVPHEVIREHVSANLQLIDKWITLCSEAKEPIVLCSGGTSLDRYQIQTVLKPEFYDKGVKIVSCKNKIRELLDCNVVPWAIHLLDPRDHVKGFLSDIPKGVIFFVSSMVDPDAVETLLKGGHKVIGYHSAVNAGEENLVPKHHRDGQHIMVLGGSGTSTRGISLFEALGFREFHLFGYDCCYEYKPNLHETIQGGTIPKYVEQTLTVNSYGKTVKRTFWTEPQFLAQIKEFTNLYMIKDSTELHTYGDGIIPWIHKHYKLEQQYREEIKESQRKHIEEAKKLEDILNGA